MRSLASIELRPPLPLLLLGLLSLGARDTGGATLGAPQVKLESLRVGADGATASVQGGGTRELTLDAPLQRAAVRLLAQAHPERGAIVAIDPTTGTVLTWAGVRGGAVAPSVVGSTLAPAASVFKIVTTIALLEKHVSPDRTVCAEGGSSAILLEHLMPPQAGHALCGPFREALGRSRNAVFAQLATRYLHPGDLVDTAARLGFGQDAPLDVAVPMGDLDAPEGGLEFARTAAGFVGSRLSPLGAAYLGTVVASGGRSVPLRILKNTGPAVAERSDPFSRAMHEGTAHELVRMMEVTVRSGTCREAFTDPVGRSYLGDVRVAGKTGTLQPNTDDPTTSWFVGFAPSRKPRIVVSVLLENGPGWRRKANEVGRDFLRTYFATRGYRGVTLPDGL